MNTHPECLSCECTFTGGCQLEKLVKHAPKPEPKPVKHANRKAGRPRGQGPIQLLRAFRAEQLARSKEDGL